MKFRFLLLYAALSAAAPAVAKAQVSFYADFTATRLTDLSAQRTLYGPTVGAVLTIASAPRLSLAADFRGSFAGANGVRLDGIVIGPRLATRLGRLKPYGEFMIGLARYNNGLNQPGSSTTDSLVELNAGTDYRIAKLFDWRVVDYSWGKYLALGGEFNPRQYSTGIVFHTR